jgi:hypothetical protein
MWRTRKLVHLFLCNDQETPYPESHEYDGICDVVHHLTGKLFPQAAMLSQDTSCFFSDACPNVSQDCKSVLFGSSTRDLNLHRAWAVRATERCHPLIHGKYLLNLSKTGRNSAYNALMRLDDLDQAEKNGEGYTK